jgi:hypothetical protein
METIRIYNAISVLIKLAIPIITATITIKAKTVDALVINIPPAAVIVTTANNTSMVLESIVVCSSLFIEGQIVEQGLSFASMDFYV